MELLLAAIACVGVEFIFPSRMTIALPTGPMVSLVVGTLELGDAIHRRFPAQ